MYISVLNMNENVCICGVNIRNKCTCTHTNQTNLSRMASLPDCGPLPEVRASIVVMTCKWKREI